MPRRFLAAVPPTLLLLLAAAPARAASKIAIAAQGAPVPGGGVFAGPSFRSEPSAAGNGWIAFRSQVNDGPSEAVVVRNLLTGERHMVASLGQTVDPTIGRFKQFLGRPAVNARGEVAFAAEITPPDDAPPPDLSQGIPPTPAGVFLWRDGRLSVVAEPGLDTGLGILDLTTPINLLTLESGSDIAERTPALNDRGDVAFVAATLDGTTPRGALFSKPAGQDLGIVLPLGTRYEGRQLDIIGPPALNNAGTLAFRGADGFTFDGIFKLEAGTLSLLVRNGVRPAKLPAPFTIDPIEEFGDVVALNDAGEVVCTAGPFYDNSDDAGLGSLDSPGVLFLKPGAEPLLVGFPGQRVEVLEVRPGRIFDLRLGAEQGSRAAAPALTPDGTVIFFASVNNGNSQAIFRVDPASPTGSVFPLVRFGGSNPQPAPERVGGTYLSASSSPAVDAAGNLTFTAQIAGGISSEAVIWQPVSGESDAFKTGDATGGDKGYFGGPAFSPPHLNDAGDVVFKAYIAQGTSSLGIFRYRNGTLAPIVRVRDPAPLDGAPTFTNLLGEPSVNAAGDVAFVATVAGQGRGVFVTRGETLRMVAMASDEYELEPPDPRRRGAFIRTIAAGPSLGDSGAVTFRGSVQFQSRFDLFAPDERENCVFVADDAGVRVVAAQDEDSGTGLPFIGFRDPFIRGGSVVFRATTAESGEGLFLLDGAGARPLALKGQAIGDQVIASFLGKGVLDEAGEAVFSVQASPPDDPTARRRMVLRGTTQGVRPVLQAGGRGPEGGQIRSLGRVSVSSDGDLALRMGFEPGSGGITSVILGRAGGSAFESYLRNGEGTAAGIDGRITGINQNISLNRSDRIALLATVGGGTARSAILLAAPARLRLGKLALRRGPGLLDSPDGRPRDRLRVSAVLQPGTLPQPPAGEPAALERARRRLVVVGLSDSVGPLWSGLLQRDDTRLNRRILRQRRGADSRIEALRVKFLRSGDIRIALRSRPFDLAFTAVGRDRTFGSDGSANLVPPFFLRVDVGEDGASAQIDCQPRGRRVLCRG